MPADLAEKEKPPVAEKKKHVAHCPECRQEPMNVRITNPVGMGLFNVVHFMCDDCGLYLTSNIVGMNQKAAPRIVRPTAGKPH